MTDSFFERPILNSPYEIPTRHWELDGAGQPTQRILETRRPVKLVSPIPKSRKQRSGPKQGELVYDEGHGLSTERQAYDPTSNINEIRREVDAWRALPERNWGVTPATARLLRHWRNPPKEGLRPFFCQVEAVETLIWLTEVAGGSRHRRILESLRDANAELNPDLFRIALKLATGAGKTTVMAMIIAWQAVNAARKDSKLFTRGFLVVTPGITIRDRLRVLQPNDLDNYYSTRSLIPGDMIEDVRHARIVVVNFHAFKLRERMSVSAGTRALLKGRTGEDLKTLETEGQMVQRVMSELMGMKRILVLNDEAHHCYRPKPADAGEPKLKGDERKEAEKANEAARLWISGIEAVNRVVGVSRVVDLSATPFFLRGSGYAEGTLFHWVVSDFSLLDAIESGIVKLPRVPVAENIPGDEMPVYRNLWAHVGPELPKGGRKKGGDLDARTLPAKLETALQALYGHYEKTYEAWRAAGIETPPCFIIVCQNTSISKLVYDHVAGFERTIADGTTRVVNGRLPLFRNFDENDRPIPRPNTILVDSEQLEAGDALTADFRAIAADEIERFRREIVERTRDARAAENLTDQDVLREVMNTVGKPGRLGAGIRCVVSVSMLTEGWDAQNVTHILGVRAFGTQLLCEQVIGRALRRRSYEVAEDGRTKPEYADIFGIPFDFAAQPVIAPVEKPADVVQVKAVRPDRDHLEIRFPRVEGYRVELPRERLTAEFNEDSSLVLDPHLVGPSVTLNAGIVGESEQMTLDHLKSRRKATVAYELAAQLLLRDFKDGDGVPEHHLFNDLKRIASRWIDGYLVCEGGTHPAQVLQAEPLERARSKIRSAVRRAQGTERPILAVLDPHRPCGSTATVHFQTSKTERWDTSGPPPKCHLNLVILDSDWEAEFCRVAEAHPRVVSYVKNHNLGFEVPYRLGSEAKRYRPDFIVRIDDGRGPDDLLNLVVEIKGWRGEDAKEKKATMEVYWVPGVNRLKRFGRWAFAEFTEVFRIERDFKARVEGEFGKLIESVAALPAAAGGA